MSFPFLKTDKAISVLAGGKPVMIPANHPNFQAALDLLMSGTATEEGILELMSTRAYVTKKTFGAVTIEGDTVHYKGRQMDGLLVQRLIAALKEADPMLERLMAFTDSLGRNPSYRIREQLYPFLEHGKNPITENGGFVAYKLVKSDFYDIHTGKTFKNHVGAVIQMPREDVDDDPNRTCSTGLHVCNWEYLRHFGLNSSGNRVVICEILPEDVVSVPNDYNNTKMRVCRYTVIGEVDKADVEELFNNRLYWTSEEPDMGDEYDDDGSYF